MIVVRGVPANVCDTCAEDYLDAGVASSPKRSSTGPSANRAIRFQLAGIRDAIYIQNATRIPRFAERFAQSRWTELQSRVTDSLLIHLQTSAAAITGLAPTVHGLQPRYLQPTAGGNQQIVSKRRGQRRGSCSTVFVEAPQAEADPQQFLLARIQPQDTWLAALLS